MSPQDWMVVAGGIGAFLFSFFPFVGVSFGPMSVSVNAWHSFALLGILILFAVTAVWALRILEVVKLPDAPMPWPRMLGIAAAVGTVLVLLRGVTYGHHAGLQVGGILLIVAGLVMATGAIWAGRTSPKTVGGTTKPGGGATKTGGPASLGGTTAPTASSPPPPQAGPLAPKPSETGTPT